MAFALFRLTSAASAMIIQKTAFWKEKSLRAGCPVCIVGLPLCFVTFAPQRASIFTPHPFDLIPLAAPVRLYQSSSSLTSAQSGAAVKYGGRHAQDFCSLDVGSFGGLWWKPRVW